MSGNRKFLEDIAEITKLREGSEGVFHVFRAIFRKGPISSKELAQEAHLPVPLAVAVRNELQRRGLVRKTPKGTILSSEGMRIGKYDFGFAAKAEIRCSSCDGAGIVLSDDFKEEFQRFKEMCEKRPPPRTELDQARATPFTAFSRALMMLEDGNLDGKRLCFLGDGDLVSLAVNLIGNPQEVLVIDIDEDLLKYMSKTANKQNIRVNFQSWDLRNPIPASFHSRFDVFSTDPPYSLQGSLLFLFRGLQLLKRSIGASGYLSLRLTDFEELARLQEFLISSGCVFRAIKPNFNQYIGAEILGNRSDYFLIETGPKFRNIILDEAIMDFKSSIYTGVLRSTIRTYKCVDCGAIFHVGRNQTYQTIEALKNVGCTASTCKSTSFRLIERKKAS
ncbi:MAG: bis-aminopropyl spermidine synthase family protein [Candidatus Thorarchaeota archaeon]